jgi:hypoxanthine phosphoribosyltransferase
MQISSIIQNLAQQVSAYEFDWYIAISRGGLVPACLLAQITDMRYIDTICTVSYDRFHNKNEVKIIEKDFSHLKNKKILIIDDLVDSGESLRDAIKYLSKFEPEDIKSMVLYEKEKTIYHPNFVGKKTGNNEWVSFEWEIE